MRPVVLGPLGSIGDVGVSLREIVDRIHELQRLVSSAGRSDAGLKKIVFMNSSGIWQLASSTNKDLGPTTGYGIVVETSGSTVRVQVASIIEGLSGLSAGSIYHLGPEGDLTLSTDGPIVVAMGTALSDTTLLFQPEYIGDL